MKFFSKFNNIEASKAGSIEKETETEEKIEINTVSDFISALEWSYDLAEDEETKNKIGHQIVKIEMALSSGGINADDIKVGETSPGVLGTYHPGSDNITLSHDMLSDFESSSALIAHVLCHEKTHQEGIHDEGPAELKVHQKLPKMMKFYVSEQRRNESIFHNLGKDEAISLYDIKNPEKLSDAYLEVEIEKHIKSSKTEQEKIKETSYRVKKSEKLLEEFSKNLNDAVPRLFVRLSRSEMKKKIREVLDRINDEN